MLVFCTLLYTWKPCQLELGIGVTIEIDKYLLFPTENYMP